MSNCPNNAKYLISTGYRGRQPLICSIHIQVALDQILANSQIGKQNVTGVLVSRLTRRFPTDQDIENAREGIDTTLPRCTFKLEEFPNNPELS